MVLIIMQLDRVIDDEFIQEFIRSGEGVRLCIERVDNPCSGRCFENTPGRCRCVVRMTLVWTISEIHAVLLQAIIVLGSS